MKRGVVVTAMAVGFVAAMLLSRRSKTEAKKLEARLGPNLGAERVGEERPYSDVVSGKMAKLYGMKFAAPPGPPHSASAPSAPAASADLGVAANRVH